VTQQRLLLLRGQRISGSFNYGQRGHATRSMAYAGRERQCPGPASSSHKFVT
jgi:hypothetical protein